MIGILKDLELLLFDMNKFFTKISRKGDIVEDFVKPFFVNWGSHVFVSLFAIFTYLFWMLFPIIISGILGAYSGEEIFEMVAISHIPMIFIVGLSPIIFLMFSVFLSVLFSVFRIRKNVYRNTFKVLGYSSIVYFVYVVLAIIVAGFLEYAVPKFDLYFLEKPLFILLIIVGISLIVHLAKFIVVGLSSLNRISKLKATLLFVFGIFLFILFLIMMTISIIAIILLIGVMLEHLDIYI